MLKIPEIKEIFYLDKVYGELFVSRFWETFFTEKKNIAYK